MTRRTEIRIGRLVIPPSESGRAGAIGRALQGSLAARLEGQSGSGGDPVAERIARTVAARIERQRQ